MEADLTKEECFDLGRRWRAGDRSARDRLILAHLPMARILALALRPLRWMGDDDLEAEAYAILVEQASRWEPERGVPFRAFIAMQLRGLLWTKVRGPLRGPDRVEKVHYDDLTVSDWTIDEIADAESGLEPHLKELLTREDDVGEYARALAEGTGISLASRTVLGHLSPNEARRRSVEIRNEIAAALRR